MSTTLMLWLIVTLQVVSLVAPLAWANYGLGAIVWTMAPRLLIVIVNK